MTSDVRVVRCGYADFRVAVGCCYAAPVYATHAEAAAAAQALRDEREWLERVRRARAVYDRLRRDGHPEGFTSDDVSELARAEG